MAVKDASVKIDNAMMQCLNVVSGIHRFGGKEYRLGKREIGHVHGDNLVDIPFPINVRNEIIEKNEAEVHHILPDSGWVSVSLNCEYDVDRAIRLLKKSYELAVTKTFGSYLK